MIPRRVDDTRDSDSARCRQGCRCEGSQLLILYKGSPQSGGEVSIKELGGAEVRSGVDEGCAGRWDGGSKKLER